MPLYGVHELPVELRIVLTSSKSTSRSWSVLKRGTHNAASEVVRRKPFAFKAPEIKPWSATLLYADFRGKDPTGNLVRELGKHSRAGDAKQCMQLLEALKNERRYSGQSVTLHMYKLALTALAKNGLYRESCRLVEEIADTPGQHADIGCFNLLLKAAIKAEVSFDDVFEIMRVAKCSPDLYTYQHLIDFYKEKRDLEKCFSLLEEMESKHNITPSFHILDVVINLAARKGNAEEAFGLLKKAVQHPDGENLSPALLIRVLEACAIEHYMPGIRFLAPILLNDATTELHEGLLCLVLNAAARHGEVQLARDCLSYLTTIDAVLKEHHYAALIEALCRQSQHRDCFREIRKMREADVSISPHTLDPLVESILLRYPDAKAPAEEVKKSLKSYLQDLEDAFATEPSCIDITLLNALLKATIRSGDFFHALSIYKRDMKRFDVVADVDTFNALLRGCAKFQARQLGIDLYSEMQLQGLKPNVKTHERMIDLYCWCSDVRGDYLPAFDHLESIKALEQTPNMRIYKLLRDRLTVEGDTDRLELVSAEVSSLYGDSKQPSNHRKRKTPVMMPNSRVFAAVDAEAGSREKQGFST